jgi:tetratricopeptide (TPR) repeat protein
VARLFISHSSANNAAAVALTKWLSEQGFEDFFIDIDQDRGFVPGQRWQIELKNAADRCEAVLCLISPEWVRSNWCVAEFLLAKILRKRVFGVVVEPVPLESLPTQMTAEWQLSYLSGEGPARTFDVKFNGKCERVQFREQGLQLLWRGLDSAGLDAWRFPWPPSHEPKRSPYRGLRALEAEDASIFFGRDAEIVRGLDRIRALAEDGVDNILVVLGASGSGKSSFLRAGLWPRLARDDTNFLVLPVVRPEGASITGVSGLAASLTSAFDQLGAPRSLGGIKEELAAGVDRFITLLDQLIELAQRRLVGLRLAKAPTIALALDQAEELFNAEGTEEATKLLELLSGVFARTQTVATRNCQDHLRFLVVVTIRSDRYQLLQEDKRLLAGRHALLNLPPIPVVEFKTVIEGPARRATEAGKRLAIDPALTARLVADAEGMDALPLLAFTLQRLFTDYGNSGEITLANYVKLGGVQGSLEAAVTKALADPHRRPAIPVDKEAQVACLRSAFIPWLARIDPASGLSTRRLARSDDIPRSSHPIIERLVEARLLISDRRDGVDTIEIAHESLLRRWPALTAWLENDAEDLKVVESVERAAEEWVRNRYAPSWLDHRDERLLAAERVAGRADFRNRLGQASAAYITACRARQDGESRRLAQRRKILTSSLIAATILFACIAGFSIMSWRMAQSNLAAARGAISTLVETISEDVQPIAQLDQVQSLIDQARRTMNTFATITKDPGIILQDARTLLILADIDWDRGQISRMKDEAERALNDVAPLANEGNLEARHQRARAFRFIGLANWEAYRNEEARDLYRQGIDDLKQVLNEYPNEPSAWQREESLADLEQELGDVLLFRLGDTDGALAAFEACHAERLRVRELGHNGPGIDEAIAWAENKFGDVQWRLGNVDAALKWFTTARNSIERLGDHLWDNLRWPHGLALIYNNIGLVHHRRGQFREAENAFESAQALLKDVIKRDQHNFFRMAALAWTLDNEGETLMRLALQTNDQEELKKAHRILTAAQELRHKLAATAPDKVDYQLSVIDTRANIASVAAAMQQLSGDQAEAAKGFQRAADLILEGYGGARYLRPAALVRSIGFLDLSALEFSRATQPDEARAALERALKLADANKPMLGNLYVDLTSRLQKHFSLIGNDLEVASQPL